jgi:hypothetical protein
VSHYPIYSGGSNGNNDILISQVLPLLEKYNVDAYLSGHVCVPVTVVDAAAGPRPAAPPRSRRRLHCLWQRGEERE